MTAMESDDARHLPTQRELELLLSKRRAHLVNLVAFMATDRDASWCEDIVQTVVLETLQKIALGTPFVRTTLWQYLCWKARNRVIDQQRSRELQLIQDFATHEDDGDSPDLAAQIPARDLTPLAAALQHERLERKKKLLSDILEEYCRHCERQARMLSGKEIFERMLRGESPDETARAMGVKRNTVDKARRDARLRLRELMQKHDVHQSVFQTFYRREQNPLQQERKNQGTVEVHSTSELFRWIMDEAGALCPLEERLRQYADAPADEQFRDIRYHVATAGCPLCRGVLAAWQSEG